MSRSDDDIDVSGARRRGRARLVRVLREDGDVNNFRGSRKGVGIGRRKVVSTRWCHEQAGIFAKLSCGHEVAIWLPKKTAWCAKCAAQRPAPEAKEGA